MSNNDRQRLRRDSLHSDGPQPKKRKAQALRAGEEDGHQLCSNETYDHAKEVTDSATREEPAGPACCSCRKKKAKCSRTQPCTQCVRLDITCTYNDAKLKPGMRTGAIESLTQRVATLENMFLGQSVIWQQIWKSLNPDTLRTADEPGQSQDGAASMNGLVEDLKGMLNELAYSGQNGQAQDDVSIENQLPRAENPDLDEERSDQQRQVPRISETYSSDEALTPLSDHLVDSLVEIYFEKIHPWIPMLHTSQFRAMLKHPAERQRHSNILHAIISLCMRFSQDPRLDASPNLRSRYATRSRQRVILASMESFSVENLQALIICAFDIIGSGRGPSAWSIVGSMTRTVEQLRLSVEEDEDENGKSSTNSRIRRMAFLAPSSSWTEAEGRRRVFWNVFLMDRFCSIATGWNLSLTTADVKRRLPCEGALWAKSDNLPVPTPYFGVSDQSYNSYPFRRNGRTSKKRHHWEASHLRLVQWKVLLPEKWREACVLNSDGNMDPNLTLAHITQNTAVVLLHQAVAYPKPKWQSMTAVKPSSSSAETCQAAAKEVSIIAQKFLQNSSIPTSPQFAFCLFVCCRMLITHAAFYNAPLSTAYDSLVTSLEEISRRWGGPHCSKEPNLASRFASRLIQVRREGAPQEEDIRESAFAEQARPLPLARRGQAMTLGPEDNPLEGYPASSLPFFDSGTNSHNIPFSQYNNNDGSPDSISLAFPPLPLAFQGVGDHNQGLSHASMMGQTDDSAGFILNLDNFDLLDQRVSMFSHANSKSDFM
uniref:Zn(2)-C6 fungal-type domain-containing protein n=1 Tax=Bionectria ochroleuca TaxID=29856 RepID=A0A8H7NR10_BIOOC